MKLCVGKNIIDLLFPIGSIITNSSINFNPNEYYSNSEYSTTWIRIKGKVIVGVDESDSDFNTANKTGGEKQHTLSTNEMPSHSHTFNGVNNGASVSSQLGAYPARIYQDCKPNWTGYYINNSGGNQSHNNLQPYITKYVWERIT